MAQEKPATIKQIKQLLDAQTKSFDTKLDKRFDEQTKSFDAKLDKRFAEQTKSFDTKLDKRFAEQTKNLEEMMNEKVNVILDAVDERIGEVESDVKEIKENVGIILKSLDVDVDKKSAEKQEETMLEGKVQRHEKWIKQIAQKVDLQLET